MIEPHRHDGVFVARGKEDALVTLNFVPGSEVYGEKRISVEVRDVANTITFSWQYDEKRRGRNQCHDFEEAKSLASLLSIYFKSNRTTAEKSDSFKKHSKADP